MVLYVIAAQLSVCVLYDKFPRTAFVFAIKYWYPKSYKEFEVVWIRSIVTAKQNIESYLLLSPEEHVDGSPEELCSLVPARVQQ